MLRKTRLKKAHTFRGKQHLLRVPVDLDLSGSPAFRYSRHSLIPDRSGVYLIYDLRGPLYVGRTSSLSRRFLEHYWYPANELLALAMYQPVGDLIFSWVIANDGWENAVLETRLITWLRPLCNCQQPISIH